MAYNTVMKILKKWIFLVILGFFGVSALSMVWRIYRVNRDFAKKAQLLESKKAELSQVVSMSEYLQSHDFVEKEIRDKLGYTKQDEVLLILPSDEELLKMVSLDWDRGEGLQKPLPNWKKWYATFFEKN